MSGPGDNDGPRAKPTDRGWLDAKRDVEDRNDEARKAGKKRQAEHEKRLAEMKRNSKAER